jgi:hypothetical protein
MVILRIIFGLVVCLPALLLPYALRTRYFQLVALIVHSPFILFGFLARYLMRKLGIRPS